MTQNLLAIDQGTTGSTALVCDTQGHILGRATVELPQHFPQPGWVEHDPGDIRATVEQAVAEALVDAGLEGKSLAAIGITNQRETALIWDRATGRPIQRAIVWQDRRTAAACEQLKLSGHEKKIQERTGLVVDPYFSASKVAWMLDNVSGARHRAATGELLFGTVDSYLVWWLAGGAAGGAPHVIEVSNASRTSLMNLRSQQWDPYLSEVFRVPSAMLPRIAPSTSLFAKTHDFGPLPDGIPITGIAGDQQAALFGQGCFTKGQGKCTYGTGAFVVVNTGQQPVASEHGLLSTVAWQIGHRVSYALEGSCFVAGAAVQWLRDGLGIIKAASEVEVLARTVPSSEGVVFVPALSGLGAPHWDPEARGTISGLTRGSHAGHIARATLQAIALQVYDLLEVMKEDLSISTLAHLRVDGGAARNNLLMQMQSDYCRLVVQRPSELESTARGAVMLAGIGAGIFSSAEQASTMSCSVQEFQPKMCASDREFHINEWQTALMRTMSRPEVNRAGSSRTHEPQAEVDV